MLRSKLDKHYALYVSYPPENCGPNSSTGVGGQAVLIFDDGQLLELRRTSGTACFAFPFITIEEHWVVAGGTGRFHRATGELLRQAVGDVTTGEVTGTLIGTITVQQRRRRGTHEADSEDTRNDR